MSRPPPCVLTVAGSDSGGGAGLQADARALRALGCHALSAVTALTAQNGRRVTAWRPVGPALIAAQIGAVFEGFPVAAVKTGLLPGAAAVRAVARELARRPRVPLVVDPVMGSSSGSRFLSAAGLRALDRELAPRAALVTPNWPEAEALTGRPVRSAAAAERAARELAERWGVPVLVKGGHGPGRTCRDCLARPGGRPRVFSGIRIKTKNTHGTGCVLSAAIAAGLARGLELEAAIATARRFLASALRRGRKLDWGAGGAGPALV